MTNNSNTTPTTPAIFCPLCGALMDIQVQDFSMPSKNHYPPLIYICTCWRADCVANTLTTTPDALDNGTFLARFGLVAKFDYVTGEALASWASIERYVPELAAQ